MQRRQVVVGHVVHGHLVVQQQLDAVEVVALRRHVERRQTVLEGRQKKEAFVRGRARGKYSCMVKNPRRKHESMIEEKTA